MNEDDFKRLLREALDPIKKQLDHPETGLKRINDRLDSLAVSVLTIEGEIKIYSDMYKVNQLNIERLDTRLTTAEMGLNITPPEDLKVPHFSN